jgi:hypothetical protein
MSAAEQQPNPEDVPRGDVERIAIAIYNAADRQSGDCVGTVIYNSEHLFVDVRDGETEADATKRITMDVCRDAARAALSAMPDRQVKGGHPPACCCQECAKDWMSPTEMLAALKLWIAYDQDADPETVDFMLAYERALTATKAALAKASGDERMTALATWQAAETVPTDEYVLAWCPVWQSIEVVSFSEGRWWDRDSHTIWDTPTHWQPLPSPPDSADNEEGK